MTARMPIVEQGPGRVLARRAAAEIVARHDDVRLAVGGLVQDEVGILRAVIVEAHLREQARAQAGALDRLEILLGDDHVRIDVHDLERRRDARQRCELVHGLLPVERVSLVRRVSYERVSRDLEVLYDSQGCLTSLYTWNWREDLTGSEGSCPGLVGLSIPARRAVVKSSLLPNQSSSSRPRTRARPPAPPGRPRRPAALLAPSARPSPGSRSPPPGRRAALWRAGRPAHRLASLPYPAA